MFKFAMFLPSEDGRLPLNFLGGGAQERRFGSDESVLFFCPSEEERSASKNQVAIVWEPLGGSYPSATKIQIKNLLTGFFGEDATCCAAFHGNSKAMHADQLALVSEASRSTLLTREYNRRDEDSIYTSFRVACRSPGSLGLQKLIRLFQPDLYAPATTVLLQFLPSYLAGRPFEDCSSDGLAMDRLFESLSLRVGHDEAERRHSLVQEQAEKLLCAGSADEVASEYELLRKQLLELASDLA